MEGYCQAHVLTVGFKTAGSKHIHSAQVLGRVLLLPPFLGDQPAIDLLYLAEADQLLETYEVGGFEPEEFA